MPQFTTEDKFLTPHDLSTTQIKLRRILLIGACITDAWKLAAEETQICAGCDHILFNNAAELPEKPPFPISDYDFQVIALPLRTIANEMTYFRLNYNDLTAYETLLQEAEDRLCVLLSATMRWNIAHGLTTFVANFFLPQQNALGRLFPRYDIRNPVHFMELLNSRLAAALARFNNVYLLDIDQISASIGRRYIQDDSVFVSSHNALLNDYGWGRDQSRLEKPEKPVTQVYRAKNAEFIRSVFLQLYASYRTMKQEGAVKLIITDLDDTLWRGVIADAGAVVGDEMEGWPIGYAEALSYLKKRGIMLGIVSKNEETVIRNVWSTITLNRLTLDDFAFVKINWNPKSENVREIIKTANVLPKSVLFIDDNPVERESVRAALPGVRVLGSDPYSLKRVLLWSSETQVVTVTYESAHRTEVMKAQIAREDERKAMSREDFLNSLSVKVRLKVLTSSSDPHFARVFELLNKTNQFNTTGKRWSQPELLQAMMSGTRLLAFFVEDKFANYGLVGSLLLSGNHIGQYVMSCRVLGLEAEIAALAAVLMELQRSDMASVSAELVETEANFPVRDLYERAGFESQDGRWQRRLDGDILGPPHVIVDWVNELNCSDRDALSKVAAAH